MRNLDQPITDDDLLVAARNDPDALARFYRRHVTGMLGFLGRRLRDPELAADVCAEVFAALLVDIERYDPRFGTGTAWLYGIARHKLADAQRRGRAESGARQRLGIPRLELTDEAIERIEDLAELGAAKLDVALSELPAVQRDAVRARVLHEHSYAEIAAAYDTTEANVRQRVTRGLARLRRRVQEDLR